MIRRATHNPPTLLDGLIIDLFAGGGGASLGIERALGRAVDYAINHDPQAVGMHRINHPHTRHLVQDVLDVDPRALLTPEQWIALLWLSPDCTYHSKAKGGKPIRDPNRRSRDLAWVALRWAGLPAHQRPRIICLENVEEWLGWGPLRGKRDQATGRVVKLDGTVARPGEVVPLDDQWLIPCRRRRGRAFRLFVRTLRELGYAVEWRQLGACDYGAPTIRKRLFLVARCDGQTIQWPEVTHGAVDQAGEVPGLPARQHTPATTERQCQAVHGVVERALLPFRTAAECIDFGLDCPSIFTRRRPLAANTCKRIAAGVIRHVIEAAEPFIVNLTHGGRVECANATQRRTWRADEPLRTQTAHPKGGHHALMSAWLVKHFGGVVGCGVDRPAPTQTVRGTQTQLVAAHLAHLRGTNRSGHAIDQPAPTITSGGLHNGLVAALLAPYYGSGSGETGRSVNEPMHTVTTKDRHALVQAALVQTTDDGDTQGLPAGFWRVWQFLVDYIGEDAPPPVVVLDRGDGPEVWPIMDIGMRMLQPRELYRAMGFPDDYAIDRYMDEAGEVRPLTKTASVRMCGNSVAVDCVEALLRANVGAAEPAGEGKS